MAEPRVYSGLEGSRGILAWIVFLSHVVQQTSIGERLPGSWSMMKSGDQAVSLFIIISGFVITHLVLSKAEPWPVYIVRRACRIFPGWLACLTIALLVQPYEFQFLTDLPWHDNPHPTNQLLLQAQELAAGRGPIHLALHLTLLHGMVPEQILDQSTFIFLPPGWSLSLEWQFYLIAPLLIAGCLRKPLVTFAICAAGMLIGRAGAFGTFPLPAFLPLAILTFWIGIMTRIAFERFDQVKTFPVPLALIGLAIAVSHFDWAFLGLWIAFCAYMKTTPDAKDAWHVALSRLIDTPFMRAVGDRSYSVYLVHWPCVAASASLAVGVLHLGPWATFGFTLLAGFIATAVLSDLIYRTIERPGIRLGRLLAQRLRVAA